MKINTERYNYSAANAASTTPAPPTGDETEYLPESGTVGGQKDADGRQDTMAISGEASTQSANGLEISTSKPEDSSSELTHRLVAAFGQFEVRQVISAANKAMISLRMIAAVGNGEDQKLAQAYIKKLEKLLNRADRKISDLDKEDSLKLQSVRAKRQKQERRAEELKAELRKTRDERKAREKGYLIEDMQENISGAKGADGKLDAASEAAITAEAKAIAAAETVTESVGSVESGASPGAPAEASAGADAGSDGVSTEAGINMAV